MSVYSYRDLDVWKKSIALVTASYAATSEFPASERYGLTSQIRRAAISVSANIAEGQGRQGKPEFMHHLSIAKGSLTELDCLFVIAQNLGFTSENKTAEIGAIAEEVGRMLWGLIKALSAKRQSSVGSR